jgi:preprotein translocase SecE subunit
MGDRKYVHLVFMAFAIIFSWLAIKVVDWVWLTEIGVKFLGRHQKLYSNGVGMIIGFLLVGKYWRKENSFDSVNMVISELRRVTWPKKKETQGATMVVLVTVFISAIIMGLFDIFWSKVTDWLLS